MNEKQAMSEIIGNEALKRRLCRDIMSETLSHAYIIEGPAGSGKHTLAIMAAAALACECKDDMSKPLPCLSCLSCKKILEKKSPDVIIYGTEGKASIGVDIARFLKESVHILPNDLEQKIYIIEDADKMTPQAQNAILLTLEEPPSFVHFFLLCTNASLLLETIRSRAITLRTEPVTDEQIDSYVSSHDRRAAQMKLASPDEYYQLIKASDGGIGKALDFLEPKRWKPVKDNRTLVDNFVHMAVERKDAKTLIPVMLGFSPKRDALQEQLLLLSSAVRDLILLKKSETAHLCFYHDTDSAIELCDKVSLSTLFTLEKAITDAIDENKRNANVKLMLTKMLISAQLI